jgi:hypothetical protein
MTHRWPRGRRPLGAYGQLSSLGSGLRGITHPAGSGRWMFVPKISPCCCDDVSTANIHHSQLLKREVLLRRWGQERRGVVRNSPLPLHASALGELIIETVSAAIPNQTPIRHLRQIVKCQFCLSLMERRFSSASFASPDEVRASATQRACTSGTLGWRDMTRHASRRRLYSSELIVVSLAPPISHQESA